MQCGSGTIRTRRGPGRARRLLAESAACLAVETAGETSGPLLPPRRHRVVAPSSRRRRRRAGTALGRSERVDRRRRAGAAPRHRAHRGHGRAARPMPPSTPTACAWRWSTLSPGPPRTTSRSSAFRPGATPRDLIDLLDVQPDGDGRFIGGVHSDGRRPVVEASQMLGQAIVAGIAPCARVGAPSRPSSLSSGRLTPAARSRSSSRS